MDIRTLLGCTTGGGGGMASRGERWGTEEMHWPPFKVGKEKGGVATRSRDPTRRV
jgi:hypothetical protein